MYWMSVNERLPETALFTKLFIVCFVRTAHAWPLFYEYALRCCGTRIWVNQPRN